MAEAPRMRVGTDIIEISRFQKAGERWGTKLLERVFCAEEREYCLSKSYPWPHLAARFAAKEALLKAAGGDVRGLFRWVEIGVLRQAGQPPEYRLLGRAKEYFESRGLSIQSLSLSHSREHAVAVVLVEVRAA